MKNLSKL